MREHDTTYASTGSTTDDPFPEFDSEYETVTGIQDRMMEARDNWRPPEKPRYEPNSDADPTLKTGIVRSLDETTSKSERTIRLGVDAGDSDQLTWISVTDTDERSRTNPWVRACQTYGVHPEMPQDFYNTEVEFNPAGRSPRLFINPQLPVLSLFHEFFWMPHHRLGLWTRKRKASGFRGVVPTGRFFIYYRD